MTDSITNTDHTYEHKLTAEQVEEDCPAKLQELGKQITAHLTKATQCEDKAEQHRISAGQLLAEAKKACDDGGFDAFREKCCPKLAKSRAYELLAIAINKKSIEESKANTRGRVAKHQANKANSVTVTEKPSSIPKSDDAPGEAEIEAPSIVPEQTPELAKPRSSVQPKDDALFGFTAVVLDLDRRTAKQKPGRFATTSVAADKLAKLGKFLSDLAILKKADASKPMPAARSEGNATVSPAVSR